MVVLLFVFFSFTKYIMNNTTWAMVWITGGASIWWILNYFWISIEMLSILAAVLVLDFIFGVLDAYITKQEITSDKMKAWFFKKLIKFIIPFVVIIIIKATWMEGIHNFTNAIMSILILSEGYSIIWHFYSIETGEKLPEIDAFKMLVNKISLVLKKMIGIFGDEIHKEDSKSDKEKE